MNANLGKYTRTAKHRRLAAKNSKKYWSSVRRSKAMKASWAKRMGQPIQLGIVETPAKDIKLPTPARKTKEYWQAYYPKLRAKQLLALSKRKFVKAVKRTGDVILTKILAQSPVLLELAQRRTWGEERKRINRLAPSKVIEAPETCGCGCGDTNLGKMKEDAKAGKDNRFGATVDTLPIDEHTQKAWFALDRMIITRAELFKVLVRMDLDIREMAGRR